MAITDNYQHQHGQNQGNGVALVSSLFTRQDGAGGVEHATGTIRQATFTQMRPQVIPLAKMTRQQKIDDGQILCDHEECGAYPMRGMEFCNIHARQRGLVEPKKKA